MRTIILMLLLLPLSCMGDHSLLRFSKSECAKPEKAIKTLENEYEIILKRNKETAKLYTLKEDENLKDISSQLLKHANTSEKTKTSIKENYKYYVFSYLSDGLKIKGYISIPPNAKGPLPLIIMISGGNRMFGLPHPGGLSTQEGYAVIMTAHRGGVSEGKDQYGGEDVNDIKNLVDYLPALEQQLNVQFHPTDKYLMGVSRGGMQLFLALGRHPELQGKIKKAVSISGLLNFEQAVNDRSDFKGMLIDNFGLTNANNKTWVAKRQPLNYAEKLSKGLSILIAQGTQDTRVCLKEGYDMLQALHNAGHEVTYIEVEAANHGFGNAPDVIPVIMEWLKQP